MVCRVPYCRHLLQHAAKRRRHSGLQNGSSCNFLGSTVTPGEGSSEDSQEMTAIPPNACGTDPELMRVSDGDGPAFMFNAATTTDNLRQHAAAATTAQKVV